MGAYSSLATLGLNLALSQAAQRSRSDQLSKQEDQQASDILASDAATREQQASDLAQRMAAERARLGAAGVSPDHAYRPVRVSFRVLETSALSADLGDGPRPVLPVATNANLPAFTGDIGIRAFGWRRGMGRPPWRVVQDDPLPATILSVTTEIKVND